MKKIIYILLLCTSCVQSYNRPPLNTPKAEEWKSPQALPKSGPVCPEPELMLEKTSFRPWWKIFNDPILDDLEAEAIKNSPTVQAALARLEQAYAQYGINLSALFPQINLNTDASRQRFSENLTLVPQGNISLVETPPTASITPAAASAGMAGNGRTMGPTPVAPVCPCPTPALKVTKPNPIVNDLSILPTLTYELDFWGKNWQAMEAAESQVKAEQEDVQTALLLLTTSVADTYLQVRTYDTEIGIISRQITANVKNYTLNDQQYNVGLINKLPVSQADAQAEDTQAALEDVKRLRELAEHSLAELIGVPASSFTLKPIDTLPLLPVIPAAVPVEVMKQRPDVRQQIDLMDAAAWNVGVAKTEYFPDFNITLDYGFAASKANKLFKWKSRTWLAAIDAVTPIFTAGKISSTIDQAIAQYKQQVASYINTVLVAYQEVEDAIYSVDAVAKQLYHLEREAAASTEAYDIANMRYRMGLENYLVVTVEEATMMAAERLAIQVKRSQYSTTISLIRSIGGVWD
ncbi:MAG: efflux transporter outer membrane subunit [Verrucomicrobia bacterium]|nr:efflux transporter outer membrane subunit [Verrucomicrobiota bacterium]